MLAEAQWTNAPPNAAPDDPAAARLELADSVGSLRARGYRFDTPLPDSARAMLIPAQLEKSLSWRVGFQNFHVITRYNRSSMYAMAVHDLAMTLGERRRQQLATAAAQAP